MTMLQDDHWFLGSGLNNYQAAIAPYHKEGIDIKNYTNGTTFWQPVEIYLYPHNFFLNFWVELGIAGLLVFSWVAVKYLFLAFRSFKYQTKNKKRNRAVVLGLAMAMVAILVQGMVDVPYFKNDLAVMFWILVSLVSLFSLYRQQKTYE